MSVKRVAVVTGANKGVGFGIVRALCQQFDGDVLLTARNVDRGQQAVTDLKREGLRPRFHQLDITDQASVDTLRTFLQENYGGLDILVNNAAINYKKYSPAPLAEKAREIMKVNFTGTLSVTRTLWSLLRPHARIVIVSSVSSKRATAQCSTERQARFRDPNLTMDDLETLMTEFVQDASEGLHLEKGWSNGAYGVSKIGETAMASVLTRELTSDPREDIVVNACCPGHVNTDLPTEPGPLTIDEGAITPVYLSLLPHNTDSPRGQFVRQKKPEEW